MCHEFKDFNLYVSKEVDAIHVTKVNAIHSEDENPPKYECIELKSRTTTRAYGEKFYIELLIKSFLLSGIQKCYLGTVEKKDIKAKEESRITHVSYWFNEKI